MASSSLETAHATSRARSQSLHSKFNEQWHKPALQLFMLVVLGHWAEHLAQAFQIYYLGWPVPQARGVLGLWYPWLVNSEVLHYSYALIMLVGIWYLKAGFVGRSMTWWTVSLVIQFWHHIEHLLLITQATLHHNLFHSPVPVSILQLWVPRVELHLFYNTIVFIPMIIGMYYHMFPPVDEKQHAACRCAYVSRPAEACAL